MECETKMLKIPEESYGIFETIFLTVIFSIPSVLFYFIKVPSIMTLLFNSLFLFVIFGFVVHIRSHESIAMELKSLLYKIGKTKKEINDYSKKNKI